MASIDETIFRKIFHDIRYKGRLVSPRNQNVLELENYHCVFPPFIRFQNFKCRKLNLDYIRDEFLWYLKGDRFDLSITEKAKIWKSTVENGYINSNYGQYIFGKINQFDNVVKILSDDKDSRRASIVILNGYHLLFDKNDIPCTYALNFRIRDNHLNMTVHMRSQDLVFGMGADAPTFSFIHEMILNSLRKHYIDLEYGDYFHFVDSLHVYERHFEMLAKIATLDDNEDNKYILVYCPQISGQDEVDFIRKLDFSFIPDNFEFCKWLNTRDKCEIK